MTRESKILRDGRSPTMTLGGLLLDAGLNEDEAQGVATRARVCTLRCQLLELTERQRRDVVSILEARDRLDAPIAVAPFVAWCDARMSRLRASLDTCPKIEGEHVGVMQRLLDEMRWENDAGEKLLWRWRNPHAGDGHSGFAERARIEDALHYAGVDFAEVYPDAQEPRRVRVRLGEGRKMTDTQIVAAHTVYVRAKMTTTGLGAMLWQKYGHDSPAACGRALLTAFHGLGLPLRQCAATTREGMPCRRSPVAGSDVCTEHSEAPVRPSHLGGTATARHTTASRFVLPDEMLQRARAMHEEEGMPFIAIARSFVDATPLSSAAYLSNLLRHAAMAEGWHALWADEDRSAAA